MAMLELRIWDATATRHQRIEAPDDVPVGRLLVLLTEKMNLPIHSPDGQIMVYKLHHRRTGQQLLDDRTLAESQVQDHDELRLHPEITAGGMDGDDYRP
jgi:hypothetical protein